MVGKIIDVLEQTKDLKNNGILSSCSPKSKKHQDFLEKRQISPEKIEDL